MKWCKLCSKFQVQGLIRPLKVKGDKLNAIADANHDIVALVDCQK